MSTQRTSQTLSNTVTCDYFLDEKRTIITLPASVRHHPDIYFENTLGIYAINTDLEQLLRRQYDFSQQSMSANNKRFFIDKAIHNKSTANRKHLKHWDSLATIYELLKDDWDLCQMLRHIEPVLNAFDEVDVNTTHDLEVLHQLEVSGKALALVAPNGLPDLSKLDSKYFNSFERLSS